MKFYRLLVGLIILAMGVTSFSCVSQFSVNREVKKELVAEINVTTWLPESFRISPDNKIFAYTNKIGSQQVVIINGKEQKRYDEVNGYYLVYSEDSKHIAYPARIADKWYMVVDGKELGPYNGFISYYLPYFSPDGNRIIFVITEEEKFYVVVDEKIHGPYDEVKYYGSVFSPDSKRYSFAAKVGGKWIVVADGKESEKYDAVNAIAFSPDSKQLAVNVTSAGKGYMLLEGKEVARYDEVSKPFFSRDGKNFYYVARNGNDHFLVTNGKAGKAYADISSLSLSDDGNRVAYTAQLADGRWVVVLDGVESGPYLVVSAPVFSPDSQHIAYAIHDGEKGYVVLDGNRQEGYKDIMYTTIIFSPDSQRLAYVALSRGTPEEHEHEDETKTTQPQKKPEDVAKYVVVVDGIKSREWDGIAQDSLIFSPDSKNFAYVALNEKGKFLVVRNNKAYQQFDDIGYFISFSPDSRLLVYTARIKDKIHTIVNGDEGEPYDAVFTIYGGKIVFDADGSMHYMVYDKNKVYLVKETIGIK